MTEETVLLLLSRLLLGRCYVPSISGPVVLLLCPSGIFSGNDEYAFGRASTLALGEKEREGEQWAS